ncbi:hypothetical protein [Mycobacterium terramassiliense]|uniref:hypothetical protein n=1 Tax=Mycobacterium terramassiliense TaxID=1841859 RepID=UPI00097DC5AA|nr:hypothetical protein [Mycobacterium terramassiliense]
MADDEDTGTQSFVPNFDDEDDTGTQSFVPNFDDEDDTGAQPAPKAPERPAEPETSAAVEAAEGEAGGVPVQPVTVPGRYLYLKWWQLVLVLLGVWMVSAVVGLGLFYWWYHSVDKTATAFAVLVYVVACAVGGVMLAMAQGRALLSALSLAVMSGPFASVAAAAPLYGYYFCERTGHCLIGVIPY